VMMNVVGESLF